MMGSSMPVDRRLMLIRQGLRIRLENRKSLVVQRSRGAEGMRVTSERLLIHESLRNLICWHFLQLTETQGPMECVNTAFALMAPSSLIRDNGNELTVTLTGRFAPQAFADFLMALTALQEEHLTRRRG
jgi:hypothetical protein